MNVITIDAREPAALITYLKRKYKGKIEFVTKLLDEGDFVTDHAIVERKEIGDLYSSIMDGRLKNQCCKMSTQQGKVPILIVHGNLQEKAKELRIKKKIFINEQMVYSTLAEIQCRYQIMIVWTEDIKTAMPIMVSLIQDIEEGKWGSPATCKPEQLFARLFKINTKQYLELVKNVGSIREIADATPTKLMAIKGIGEAKAKHIKEILNGRNGKTPSRKRHK